MKFEVRTDGNPASFVAAVNERIQLADRSLKPTNVRSLTAQIDDSLTQERLIATVSSGFGLLAVLLASIGLYGVMSYTVTRRTAEIGIRIALGAERRDILWMISREVLVLCIIGIAIGVPAALAVANLVTNLLFGVKPNDPLVIATAVFVMTGVALLAGYLPARRASKVDPLVALRYE
jgi:ABC-type antimicrobial peptide transport system permease subunit